MTHPRLPWVARPERRVTSRRIAKGVAAVAVADVAEAEAVVEHTKERRR
jgi:hypothetical protein